MADRECPSCGTVMNDKLTCPECGHNLASSFVSTGSRATRNSGQGADSSDHFNQEPDDRSAENVAAQASGNVTEASLNMTRGISGTYLYDQPPIEYLRDTEQVEYLLKNINKGLKITHSDGTEETPDHAGLTDWSGRRYLLITDQRILYIAGYEDGDKTQSYSYEDIVAVESNRGFTEGRVSFEMSDGTVFDFVTSSNADEVGDAAEYIHSQAPSAAEMSSGGSSKIRAVPGVVGKKADWWGTDLWRGITPMVIAQSVFIILAVPGIFFHASFPFEFGWRLSIIFIPGLIFVYMGLGVHWHALTLSALILSVLPTAMYAEYVTNLDIPTALSWISIYFVFLIGAAIILAIIHLVEVLSLSLVVGGIITVLTQSLLTTSTPLPSSVSIVIGLIPGLIAAILLMRHFEYVVIASTASFGAIYVGGMFVLMRAGRAAQSVDALGQTASAVLDIFTSGTGSLSNVTDPIMALGVSVTLEFYAMFIFTTVSGIVVQSIVYEDNELLTHVADKWHGALSESNQTGEFIPEKYQEHIVYRGLRWWIRPTALLGILNFIRGGSQDSEEDEDNSPESNAE